MEGARDKTCGQPNASSGRINMAESTRYLIFIHAIWLWLDAALCRHCRHPFLRFLRYSFLRAVLLPMHSRQMKHNR